MITVLDSQSWAKELVTGNAEFVIVPGGGSPPTSETIWIVSNVRSDNTFTILRSNPVPPDPGPGSSFTTVATIVLPHTTIDFDPVAVYDTTGSVPLIHIIGTANEVNPNRVDLLLYTLNTSTLTVTGPAMLISGSSIQTAYDIVALNDSVIFPAGSPPFGGGGPNHKLVAAAVNNPQMPPLFQGTITNVAVSQSTLTVTANNSFNVGQLVAFAGLSSATFLNNLTAQVTTSTGTQFTALFYYRSVAESRFIPAVGPFTVVANNFSTFESDVKVVFTSNGIPLVPVSSSPGPGQYVPGTMANTGTYTFNAADANKGILITYNRFYTGTADTGTATPVFSGQSLIAFELDANNIPVANSLQVLANSPERTGNVVSSVSIITPDALNAEVYYESHPKTFAFTDQVFTINLKNLKQASVVNEPHTIPMIPVGSPPLYSILVNNAAQWSSDISITYAVSGLPLTKVAFPPAMAGQYSVIAGTYYFNSIDAGKAVLINYRENFYVWDASPTIITTFQGRYTDDRLTALLDSLGNRYISQTYFTQSDHPEGVTGNALLGTRPAGGQWIFHPTFGSVAGGSILQGTLLLSMTQGLHYAFLLAPFEAVPRPLNSPAAYPLHVAAVNTTSMAFTDVTGFFNQQAFTWLRGTKSVVDDLSLWAAVGERESLSNVSEVQLIPATVPYSLLVNNAGTFWQNSSVVDNSGTTGITYTPVINRPAKGQYVVLPNGEYVFNAADASVGIIGLDLTSNILTVTGSNIANLTNGMNILFRGLTQSTYLNGQTVTVTGINLGNSTFTASFVHANDPQHSETGLAGKPLTIGYNFILSIVPVYVSFFNVPPIAALSPQSTASPPSTVTAYRAQPLVFSAAGSTDADGDALQFTWTESDPDTTNVTLAPSASVATLNVARAVGGNQQAHITNVALTGNVVTFTANNTFAPGQVVSVKNLVGAAFLNGQQLAVGTANALQFTASFAAPNYASAPDNGDAGVFRNFNVGVAVVDLFPDLVTLRHPPSAVTNIQISGSGVITVIANTNLASGEAVMLYGIANLSASPVSQVNDRIYTVVTWTPTSFTAITSGSLTALVSTPVTGFVIPQFQFANTTVTVPFNAAPTITFPSPQWSAGPLINVGRNTPVTLTVNPISTASYPVTVTGINDIDDRVSFLWEQTSGTTVLPGAVSPGHLFPFATSQNLFFNTNGVNIHGETLAFQLTVNDGVNPAVVAAFSVVVAAYNFTNLDTKKLSRSVWQEQDTITNVAITNNILTIIANNTFVVGQQVTFSGVGIATFLNGQTVTVVSLIGSSTPNTGFTAVFAHANYVSASDVGTATANALISQRNMAQTWSALDQSAIYSNLSGIKRNSVLDGTDRYIVVSPNSVLVYGGVSPTMVLLRKLLMPLNTLIVDAIHTEDDYTLVIDSGNLYRYSTAPLINTDNPDTTISLTALSSMRFNKIFTTSSHLNVRVLALSGPDGCLLLQVANDTLAIQSTLALTTASSLVIGSGNVQFVRLSNVETTTSGKVLLGTVTNVQANVAAVQVVADNTLTITCNNNFKVGDVITFTGFTGTTAFLNGVTVSIIAATVTGFTASLATPVLATTATATTALAVASNDGKTYETLIDLPHAQIIGTWDASKLRNQFVNTGEILFEPNSVYSGRPSPPVLNIPTAAQSSGGPNIALAWSQVRPDLVTGYNIEYAVANSFNIIVPGSLTFRVPTSFGSDTSVTERVVVTQVAIASNILTVTCGNSYVPGANITFSGMNAASFLNGQTVNVITASGTQFTATFTHADYPVAADVGFAMQTLTSLISSTKVTQVAISGNILTVTCNNNFVPGASVAFSGMTQAVFLNNITVTVLSSTPAQFTASFPLSSYGPAVDTGTAQQLSPSPNQYIVSGGLYLFNIAQQNHSVVISYLSPYAILQVVGSGATQKATFPLSSGSYNFRIQAQSSDGPSAYSNVQAITF